MTAVTFTNPVKTTATDIIFAKSPYNDGYSFACLLHIEDIARITLADIAGYDEKTGTHSNDNTAPILLP